tara:strand:- start:369 stop:848 length:480 start_codon:yes stop_codon:yes gene_type:complete
MTKYVRASLLGAVDGVITSFAIVAGSDAGKVDSGTVVIIGVSSLFADGLSMGVSEYLSSSSEQKIQGGGEVRPLLLGGACFLSFVVCGVFPILVFVASKEGMRLLACASFSLVELMLLGAARTMYTKEPLLVGLGQTAVLGGAAGGVAYAVGWLLESLG